MNTIPRGTYCIEHKKENRGGKVFITQHYDREFVFEPVPGEYEALELPKEFKYFGADTHAWKATPAGQP